MSDTGLQTSAHAHASRRFVLVLTWIYCLSWCLDFRGESGGSAFQLMTFAVTGGTGMLLAFIGWKVLFQRPLGWLILLWAVFLLTTVAVALVQGVPMAQYLRTIIPWTLVLTSMATCQVASGFGLTFRQVLLPMLIACAVNVVWRAYYSLGIAGVDVELVRVQMLSQCLPLLVAYLMCGLLLQRSLPLWPVILGGVGIASYVYSVTRSAMFIVGAAAAGAVIALLVSRRSQGAGPGFAGLKVRHLAASFAVLVAGFVLLVIANPYLLTRWEERLFYSAGSEYTSMDPSTLTRLAETEAFIKILDDDPLNYAFGMGIGHSYYWDEAYAVELAYTYGSVDAMRADFREIWFPGHAIWTYAVFSGGLFGLFAHLAFFGIAIGISWKAGRRASLSGAVPLHLAWLPFVGMLAFVSASLTFNPFIERAAGLVLGFVAALPQFILRDSIQVVVARQRRVRKLASEILSEGKGVPA